MDELELLKKDWRKHEEELPKLTYDEIHRMTWKRSSSIVKWILIISILEITLPQLLLILPSVRKSLSLIDFSAFNIGYISLSVLSYVVIISFIFQFYKRFREISVMDNARNLMRKIIATRKTVMYYIFFSLGMFFLLFLYFAIGSYFSDQVLMSIEGVDQILEKKSLEETRNLVFWVSSLGGLVLTLVMGGIYFLLYGLLIRKLNNNYKELKRLEV